MKKISLFVCALALVGQVAAHTEVYDLSTIAQEQKVKIGDVQMNQPMTFETFDAVSAAKYRAAAADFYASDYYYCEGMMHAGLAPDFYGWYPMIMIPYLDSVVWVNAVGPTTWREYTRQGWTVEDENSETHVAFYGFGTYYLPQTSEHTFTFTSPASGNDTTVNIKGYMYGEGEKYQYLMSGYHSADGNIVMTLCGMNTDTLNGGNDFYRVGAGSKGAYAHGTGLVVDEAGKTADTIGVTVRNLGTMKIEQINIPVYNISKNDAAILPDGASVDLTLYAADLTNGIIHTDEVIAKVTLTKENLYSVGDGMGTIEVKFYEQNALGVLVETPIVIEGDFYLELTNYNESGCDFGIYSDYYTPGGTTLYKVNGEYTLLWKSGGSNLAIGFDAYYPAIVNDTTLNEMNAPVAGGVAYYGEDAEDNVVVFYTNNSPEDWYIDAPEWIEYAIDTTYLSSSDAVLMQFTATEELPEGEKGRYAEVVIDADGATYTMYIKQGQIDIPDAVDTVVDDKQLFNGKRYNLLGVEVDEDYNGIVIMNGKKFIQ